MQMVSLVGLICNQQVDGSNPFADSIYQAPTNVLNKVIHQTPSRFRAKWQVCQAHQEGLLNSQTYALQKPSKTS